MPKIETAILRSTPSGEKPPKDYCQTRWITEVGDHVRLVFNALRLYKLEDDHEQTTPSERRRYPKTGGFRKNMSATDSILVHGLLKTVKLTCLEKECFSDDGRSVASRASGTSTAEVQVRDQPPDTRHALLMRYKA
eukprot:7116831-Pyramimonas_sp.AAC.1